MAKLWGTGPSTNGEQDEPTAYDSRRVENGHNRMPDEPATIEPDERTSLLRQHNLDPDDPAVSPYNRLSVRSFRALSIILLIMGILWWLVHLVTTFISLPGCYTRGGGWFALGYSTFAVGILLVSLLFYATPSKAERTILLATLFFLAVDNIMILAAYPIRNDEAWIGIASAIWALVITAWAVICDRVVENGKRGEEVRLTGRPENRYTLSQWLSVFAGTIIMSIFLIISILLTINLSIRARDGTLAPPGKMYTVEDYNFHVHLYCAGNKTNSHGQKTTTVLIEGGEEPVEGRMESWVKEAYLINKIERYCYWDRPGMAWSENGPSPLSAGRVADALSAALVKADETGPWILASHHVGGIYSRVFASRHTGDVRGLLLVDTLPESQLYRIGSPGRGLLLWIRGVLYPLGLDRIVSAIFLGHGRADRISGRDAWQKGGEIKFKLQENLVANSFTKNEINAARFILPKDTPIVVVSSGKSVKKSKDWSDGQRDLTHLNDNLIAWDVVDGAGHNVWENHDGNEILQKRLEQLVNYH